VRAMNDQISTVGAGQGVFTNGQRGPDEVVLEQGVAGSFFDFPLTHPARSENAVGTTGTTTSFRNCQGFGSESMSRPRSAKQMRSAAAFTSVLEGRNGLGHGGSKRNAARSTVRGSLWKGRNWTNTRRFAVYRSHSPDHICW
jgi:hypothetical protein